MSQPSFVIGRDLAGQTLSAAVRATWGLSWSSAKALVERGGVRLAGQVCREVAARVKVGQRVESAETGGRQPVAPPRPGLAARATIPVVHIDDTIIIVDKPAGLTTVRSADDAREFGKRAKKFLPPTLADLLAKQLGEPITRIRAVHRLDQDTTGLLVFARSPDAEANLGQQFRARQTGRRYRALVRGTPQSGRIESFLVDDRGDGRRGSGPREHGKHAITHVRVIEQGDGVAVVECELETGRTHQVRIHLGEAGTPLLGERVYDRPPHGRPLPDPGGIERTALHAASLGLHHPTTGEWREWESPLPEDMRRAWERYKEEEEKDHHRDTEAQRRKRQRENERE